MTAGMRVGFWLAAGWRSLRTGATKARPQVRLLQCSSPASVCLQPSPAEVCEDVIRVESAAIGNAESLVHDTCRFSGSYQRPRCVQEQAAQTSGWRRAPWLSGGQCAEGCHLYGDLQSAQQGSTEPGNS